MVPIIYKVPNQLYVGRELRHVVPSVVLRDCEFLEGSTDRHERQPDWAGFFAGSVAVRQRRVLFLYLLNGLSDI